MRILMINSVCGIRSTGRICTDLAKSLEEAGHEVIIAYGRERVPDEYLKYAVRIGNYATVRFHGLKARLMDADGRGSYFSTKAFLKWVSKYNPDIIHLHNLHGYYINVPLLFKYIIEEQKPVIWTLHDMWAFTGHSGTCDLANCENWREGCGNCPLHGDYPASFVDRSDFNYKWKKNLFCQVNNLTVVTPSKWLSGLVKESYLTGAKVRVIPNGIDTEQFRPLENDFKRFYGVEDKILLMGCATSWSDAKGLSDFILLSRMLDDRFKLVLVGLNKEQLSDLPENILGIEKTESVKELVYIYSASDVFLNLTYADNYPTVNLEALSCGTPVITYKSGGSAECLNNRNGKAFDRGDVNGIAQYFNDAYSKADFVVNDNLNLDNRFSPDAYEQEIGEMGGYWTFKNSLKLIGKRIVIGVAAVWDRRKGFNDFVKLSKNKDSKYIIVGIKEEQKKMLSEDVISYVRTNSVEELRKLYSVADVFVNPTYQDNYPTTNLEAIACGTPVVSYATGGSSESAKYYGMTVNKGEVSSLIDSTKDISVELLNRFVGTDIDTRECRRKYCELYEAL